MLVSQITSSLFDQLYRDHSQTLSCPCSRATIALKDFVNHTILFHPICSSVFISQLWIEALYSSMASRYTPEDFRKTASYQVNMNEVLSVIELQLDK